MRMADAAHIDGRPGINAMWLRAADVLISLAVIPAANWMILLVAAVSEGSKEKTCFRTCYGDRHLDAWTPMILLPVLALFVTGGLVAVFMRRNPWRAWTIGRRWAFGSLLVVIAVLAFHVEALSSVPPWHWLDALSTTSPT
jgi:hypothetical protein